MKRLMLVGETGAGKRSLIRVLSGEELPPRLPMSVAFHGSFINTPGEFLENRRFYRHLITAAVDCDIVAFIQDATRRASLFPPLFAASFNRKLIGIVSKTDAEGVDPERAERLLRNAGAKDIIRVSAHSGDGLEALRNMLV